MTTRKRIIKRKIL